MFVGAQSLHISCLIIAFLNSKEEFHDRTQKQYV